MSNDNHNSQSNYIFVLWYEFFVKTNTVNKLETSKYKVTIFVWKKIISHRNEMSWLQIMIIFWHDITITYKKVEYP